MKRCKKCAMPFEGVCRSCKAIAQAAWRAKSKEKIQSYSREWARKNSAAVSEHRRKWRDKNRTKISELNRKSTENISDGYVASLLGLPVALIPKDLIDTQRVFLYIKRHIKEKK